MLIGPCLVLSIVAFSKRMFALSDSCSCISKFTLFLQINVDIFSNIHIFTILYVNDRMILYYCRVSVYRPWKPRK
jgi:hypothetical protein